MLPRVVNAIHVLQREETPVGVAAADFVGFAVAGPCGVVGCTELVDLGDAWEASEIVGLLGRRMPDVEGQPSQKPLWTEVCMLFSV